MTSGVHDPAHEVHWLKTIKGSAHMRDSLSGQASEPGKGVFLAHAFTRLLNAENVVDPQSQEKLVDLINGFRAIGYAVHCALEREGWGAKLMSPETAIRLDMDQVTKADFLVSFPSGSPGAFMELGFRVATPRPTLLIRDESTTAEELYFMYKTVEALGHYGVSSLIIEDTSPDRETFERTVAAPIIDWVMQQA